MHWMVEQDTLWHNRAFDVTIGIIGHSYVSIWHSAVTIGYSNDTIDH